MNIKHFLFAGVVTAMALTACTEDIVTDSSMSGPLNIRVTDATDNTRAAYTGFTTSFESGDQIGVYVVKGSSVITDNACYTYDGTGWSTSATVEYNTGYTYYAYYPYVESPYTPDFTQSGVDGKFALFLTDASDMFHQQDQSAKASFQASDLMIAQGTDEGSKTVSFAMLHKKGLAVFDGDDVLDATFSGSNKPYTHSSKRFFLMKPSTSTEFTDDEGTYSLAASSGKYVTHGVNIYTDYVLTVSGPSAVTYAGGTDTYSITSYKQNSTGTKSKAAAWTASYDTDGDGVFDDSKPSWLTTFTASGDGSTTATNYSATVSAQSAMTPTTATGTEILQAATPVGSSTDYYDLSTNGGSSSMTTANCYMVHAPGYYKLPLVYGNAVKNGTDNETAYKPGTVSNGTDNFINHAGTKISAPWITKSGTGVNGGMNITVNGAQLIWQDVNGLTSSYTIDGDYLKFQVPAGSIAEGNAVIAVKSGSTIVWSWHIWVTPETYSNLIPIETTVDTREHTYNVTTVNLGWVGSGSITKSGYEGRSCTVQITQTGGGSETFTVTQTENITVTTSKSGNSPYYQWGRKDPFVPSTGTGNTNKTVEVGSGVPDAGYVYEASTTSTIGTNIQYPWKHYYNAKSTVRGPVSTTYFNMWDAQYSNTRYSGTKKTIYDPCPPGFCVPNDDLYNYIAGGGTTYYYDDETNPPTDNTDIGEWDSTNKGFLWKTSTPNIFFPAAGSRSTTSAALLNAGSNGNYWSASPGSTHYGRYLNLSDDHWSWYNSYRSYGYSVRPVAEE